MRDREIREIWAETLGAAGLGVLLMLTARPPRDDDAETPMSEPEPLAAFGSAPERLRGADETRVIRLDRAALAARR